MKVLHIIAEISRKRGGPTTALSGMLDITASHGVVSSVLCISAGAEEIALPEGTEIHRFPPSFPARFLRCKGAIQWLKKHHSEFDLILIHEIWPLLILEAGAFLAGTSTPYIVVAHNSLDPYDVQKKRALKIVLGHTMVRKMLGTCRDVWGMTSRECERLILYGTSPDVEVIPCAVPMTVSNGDGAAFRKELGITADERILLFLSRLDPKKGVDVLLGAFADLRESHPGLRLVIAGGGDGSRAGELQQLANDLALGDKAIFAGFVAGQRKADAFASASLFVLPSRYESFGIAVVEAMHAGVPVLVSDQVFLSDEIAAAGAGAICKPQIESVTAQIAELLNNPALCAERAARGKILAQQFLPSNLAAQLMGAMQKHVSTASLENPSYH